MKTDEHLAKAEHNEHFVAFALVRPEFLDWAINGAFYAAVHYVEAVLAQHRQHSFSHANRNDGINRCFRAAYKPYRKLQDASTNARYVNPGTPVCDFGKSVGAHLREVKRLVQGELRGMGAIR